jgi:hypothetical protein
MGIPIREPIKKNRLMSIDPSINNVGMAIWELPNALMMYKLLHPKVNARNNEYDKSLSILQQLQEWIKVYSVNRMILEIPEHWAVAGFEARENGSIAKLMLVVGLIYSLRPSLDELKIVKPREWKGQLPKDVMVNRLKDDYLSIDVDLEHMNPNVADAIGIGHFYITGSV